MAIHENYQEFRKKMLKPVFPGAEMSDALSQMKQYSAGEKSVIAIVFLQLAHLQELLTEVVKDSLLSNQPEAFVAAMEASRGDSDVGSQKGIVDTVVQRASKTAEKHDEIMAAHTAHLKSLDDVFGKLNESVSGFETLRADYLNEVISQVVTYCAYGGKVTDEHKALQKLTMDGAFDKLISGKGVLRGTHFKVLKNYLIELGNDWAEDEVKESSEAALNVRESLLAERPIVPVIDRFVDKIEVSALNQIEKRRMVFLALLMLLFDPDKLEDREISFGSIIDDASALFAEGDGLSDKLQKALETLQQAMDAFKGKVLPYLEELGANVTQVAGLKDGLRGVTDRLTQEIEGRKEVLSEVVTLQQAAEQRSDASPSAPSPR